MTDKAVQPPQADELLIRAATPADAGACLAIFRAAVMAGTAYSRPQRLAWQSRPYSFRHWRLRQTRNITLVAESAGRIAGFTEFRPDGHVHMLFVHPDAQGRGIARSLLDEGDRILSARGVTRRDTWASHASMPVFRRAGFQVLGARLAPVGKVHLLHFRMARCGSNGSGQSGCPS